MKIENKKTEKMENKKMKILTSISLIFMQSILTFAHSDEGNTQHHMMDNLSYGIGFNPMFFGLIFFLLIILIIVLLLKNKK